MAETKAKEPDYAALAQQAVDQGQVPTPPSTLYFSYTRTDGDKFVAPASNAELYLRKGYTIGDKLLIEDLVSWNAENSATEAPAPTTTEKTDAD